MSINFNLQGLDHVAIRVANLEQSRNWYQSRLKLIPLTLPEWGAFPIMMMSEKTSVALFPASNETIDHKPREKTPGIIHFAFRLDQESFMQIQLHLSQLEEKFTFEDHFYFHSIYLSDPDGHTVELTTKVKDFSIES